MSKRYWSAAKARSGGIVSQGFLPRLYADHGQGRWPFRASARRETRGCKTNSPSLRHLFARYADCMMAQMFQSTACNAIHSIEQRTVKWIIAAMERTGSDLVPLTHEQLSTMLGVGRSYASRVIQTFKQAGILETRRGAILTLNRDALALHACLCNEAVKGHSRMSCAAFTLPWRGRAQEGLKDAIRGQKVLRKTPKTHCFSPIPDYIAPQRVQSARFQWTGHQFFQAAISSETVTQ